MKDLIRKILREETRNKGLKLLELVKKYRSLFPKEGEKVKIINSKTGETTADDLFWSLVDDVDYKSDNDYRRVKQIITDIINFGGFGKKQSLLLHNLIGAKSNALDIAHFDEIKNVSDNSWSDLKADIISRGEDFYLKALNDFDMVQKMANDYDYNESFLYGFPYPSEF